MAQKRYFTIPSSDGKTKLKGVIWQPEGDVRMVLQIAHGMIEHIGFYEEFAGYLADLGVAVVGHDHLGHGRTAGEGKLGIFSPKDGYRYLVRDLNRIRKAAGRRFPHVPYFLMGHSMGSFMVRRYLTVFGEGLSGAVLMGTGNQPKCLVHLGLLLAEGASKLLGADYRSWMFQNLFRKTMNRRIHPVRTSMDWLAVNKEWVERYMADEFCCFAFTSSGYRDLLRMVADSENRTLLKRVPKELPLLFVSGQEDPVGGYGKGVKKACRAYQKAGVRDIKLILYLGYRHELVMENNRFEVAEDIYQWMRRYCSYRE